MSTSLLVFTKKLPAEAGGPFFTKEHYPGALGAWHALVPPALPVQGKYELRRAREVVGSVPS